MKNHYSKTMRITSIITLLAFVLTQCVPAYALRQVSEAEAKGKAQGLASELKRSAGSQSTIANAGGLTLEQRNKVKEEIRKYCDMWIDEALESLYKIDTQELINNQNGQHLFEILKEIPQYAGNYTDRAYNSLTALLKSGAITSQNQEKVLKDFGFFRI